MNIDAEIARIKKEIFDLETVIRDAFPETLKQNTPDWQNLLQGLRQELRRLEEYKRLTS
jgi:hypothetical protein